MSYVQIALLLLKIVNWFTRRVDQKAWEASGYRKAMADELLLIKNSVGLAEKDFEAAKAMTPEERRRRLGDAV